MLGISGFETSANFVEEQEPGVYPQTLRNMIVSSTLLNPLMSILSFATLSSATVMNPDNSNALLSLMAQQIAPAVGGQWIVWLVNIDAVLVLSATVLTAYIGVTGLLVTMCRDNLLPSAFLARNERFDTYHWVILFFWLVCSALIVITNANITELSNVRGSHTHPACFVLAVMRS